MSGHYASGAEPSDEGLFRALVETVGALESNRIPYLLMGGVATTSMGRPRTTDDIDLFVRPIEARAALRALEGRGFAVEETDPDWLFKAFLGKALVDVIFRSSGDVYLDQEMLDRRLRIDLEGTTASVMSPEDLLVIKAVAARESTPHHWYDALSLIAHNELDWTYLVQRARQAGPRRILSLLLYAESNDQAVPGWAIADLLTTLRLDPQSLQAVSRGPHD